MSWSGLWVLGALDDAAVSEAAPVVLPAIAEAGQRAAARAAWARWEAEAARGGGAVPVWRPDGYNTDEALHLCDMLLDSAFDALDRAGDFYALELCDRFDGAVEPYAASVRKDNPVAALFHGLGPERACALPGWAGDALLASSEVRAGFPAVESALSFTEAGRQQVLQRMSDWPDVGSDAAGILDGALRVWRETAAAGLGLVSFRISV